MPPREAGQRHVWAKYECGFLREMCFQTDPMRFALVYEAASKVEVELAAAGKFRAFIGGLPGRQPNDPARAARAIVEIAEAETAPMHLALDADALGVMTRKIDGLQKDIAAWRDTAESVVFPEVAKSA